MNPHIFMPLIYRKDQLAIPFKDLPPGCFFSTHKEFGLLSKTTNGLAFVWETLDPKLPANREVVIASESQVYPLRVKIEVQS